MDDGVMGAQRRIQEDKWVSIFLFLFKFNAFGIVSVSLACPGVMERREPSTTVSVQWPNGH
eukprot:8273924-Karenia_brevis.AAC.1